MEKFKPIVVRDPREQLIEQKKQDLNINLHKNYYNKTINNKIDNSQHTEINNNNNRYGLIVSFIIFVFKVLLIPFKILKFLYNKIEFKKKKTIKHSKHYKKWYKSFKKQLNSNEEIF